MVGITFADLAYRYRQFLIAIVGSGVVLALSLVLSGLVGGFSAETSRTIGAVGADRWVLPDAADGRVASVAVFPEAAVTVVGRSPGVSRADPLVVVPSEAGHVDGRVTTLNIMGLRLGGLGDPHVTSGRPLGPGEAVVDSSAGAAVGDTLSFGSRHFRVAGLVQGHTLFGGMPFVYLSLRDAQATVLGGRPLVTAVVTRGVPASVPAGLSAMTTTTVEQRTLAAVGPAASSIDNTRILMWAVAGLIIAALLYVSALQRVRDFAVLKALGSSSWALFASLALQAVVVALAAAAFGIVASRALYGLFDEPIAVPATAYLALPLVAVVVGLLASLVALRRATGADPAAAFSG